jgi:hypothetical protein
MTEKITVIPTTKAVIKNVTKPNWTEQVTTTSAPVTSTQQHVTHSNVTKNVTMPTNATTTTTQPSVSTTGKQIPFFVNFNLVRSWNLMVFSFICSDSSNSLFV